MDVKEAVKLAKQHVLDLFADENITNLGLEEVEYNEVEREWIVTLGFSRPWDEPHNTLASLAQASTPHRSYKIVCIDDVANFSKKAGQVKRVKHREVPS
jgi:hypothetical protein